MRFFSPIMKIIEQFKLKNKFLSIIMKICIDI